MGFFDIFKRKKTGEPQMLGSDPFVITLDGELYTHPEATDIQLSDGADEVLCAGRWVILDGKLLAITNESLAYKPSLEQMKKGIELLAEMGLDVSGANNGLLVTVYAELDQSGQGISGDNFRAKLSSDGIELIPEEATPN